VQFSDFIKAEVDLGYLPYDVTAATCHCINNCSCDCDDGIW
jgi:hypothetical protein